MGGNVDNDAIILGNRETCCQSSAKDFGAGSKRSRTALGSPIASRTAGVRVIPHWLISLRGMNPGYKKLLGMI